MKIIYFSPHLDDVVFSCGGLIWQQVQKGLDISIWTLFAGDPPSGNLSTYAEELHLRWQLNDRAVEIRREEDVRSCEILGVPHRHWEFPDCIYRQDPITGEYLYTSEEAIFDNFLPVETFLIDEIVGQILRNISPESVLVSPLGLGNHVDHQICRKVIEKISCQIKYYLDFPYVIRSNNQIESLLPRSYKKELNSISLPALQKWQESIKAYDSQISSFWQTTHEMQEEISNFAAENGGISIFGSTDKG